MILLLLIGAIFTYSGFEGIRSGEITILRQVGLLDMIQGKAGIGQTNRREKFNGNLATVFGLIMMLTGLTMMYKAAVHLF